MGLKRGVQTKETFNVPSNDSHGAVNEECTGWVKRIAHRKWNNGPNGPYQPVRLIRPIILLPVFKPLYWPGIRVNHKSPLQSFNKNWNY